jgi:hypothetical protein
VISVGHDRARVVAERLLGFAGDVDRDHGAERD